MQCVYWQCLQDSVLNAAFGMRTNVTWTALVLVAVNIAVRCVGPSALSIQYYLR
jgi:hypothetical protein